jgi:hypothetical protein
VSDRYTEQEDDESDAGCWFVLAVVTVAVVLAFTHGLLSGIAVVLLAWIGYGIVAAIREGKR